MTNRFMFKVGIESGKRTKPAVWVQSYGRNNDMSIGQNVYTKEEVANWIQSSLLKGIKKASGK